MSQIKLNLFALLALVLVTLASTYDCPEDCHCNVINIKNNTSHNHAKCTSLNGLMKSRNLPIHSIDLSNIALTRIPSHHLDKLRDLNEIDLSNNEIAEVGRLGPRVKSLNLRNNSITSGKLSKLSPQLQHLDLSFNKLTYLPLELRNLSNLRTIELSNNQINCSCDTLEVRNWLQEKHVYTNNVVKCAYPSEVKGKPWLQVKQSQMCARDEPIHSMGFGENEEDNELMMGDAPAIEGSGDEKEDNEGELGKEYMPIESKKSSKEIIVPNDEYEGSGGDERSSQISEDKAIHLMEDDDGSGSGMGPMLNIFKLNADEDLDNTTSDDIIVPVLVKDVGAEPPKEAESGEEEPISTEAAENSNDIQKASIMVAESGESKNTYVLLGVILLIVLGLILYVGIKRCKTNSRNRANDAENPRSTELLNMDKKNLGKPIQKNGTEHAPLITEKKKEDMAKPINVNSRTIYEDEKDKKTHEPLLNGDSKPQNESNNNVLPTEEEPSQPTIRQPEHIEPPYDPNHRIIPRYPPPKSPRASKQNYQNDDDPYLPSSPKTGRYSPVYSPETGRVKIKLTETPRPKTPMLVTRSKSNAGDIITTPVVRPQTAVAPVVASGQNEVGAPSRTEPPTQTQEALQNHLQEQQQQ